MLVIYETMSLVLCREVVYWGTRECVDIGWFVKLISRLARLVRPWMSLRSMMTCFGNSKKHTKSTG